MTTGSLIAVSSEIDTRFLDNRSGNEQEKLNAGSQLDMISLEDDLNSKLTQIYA
jgi:hypothetical protein